MRTHLGASIARQPRYHAADVSSTFPCAHNFQDPQTADRYLLWLGCLWVQVHKPTAVRSDSAGSLLDAVDAVKQPVQPCMLQRMAQQQHPQHLQQSTSPASASSARQNSLSHACSAASLLLKQQQGAQHAGGSSTASGATSGSSTDGAASLTGSSCSSSALKYSKDQLCCGAGGGTCAAAAAAAASISVAALAGPAADACSVIPAGGERLFDRAMGPFASTAAAAAVAGATGGTASAVGGQLFCHVQQPWAGEGCAASMQPGAPSPFGPYAFVPGEQSLSNCCCCCVNLQHVCLQLSGLQQLFLQDQQCSTLAPCDSAAAAVLACLQVSRASVPGNSA